MNERPSIILGVVGAVATVGVAFASAIAQVGIAFATGQDPRDHKADRARQADAYGREKYEPNNPTPKNRRG